MMLLLGAWLYLASPAHAEESSDSLPLEVHGFVSQGFVKTTKNQYLANSERGSFEFAEVGLNVTKTLTDRLRVGMQLFMRDLGPIGNYKPQFDWFYLDYRFRDWFGVRAGRTKVPFGLYNETNDVDSGRVPILLPQSVYPIQNRDYLLAQTGTEVYGLLPFPGAGALEYRLYGGTIYLDNASSQTTIPKLNVPYVVGGRLMWQTPLDGLQIGGSVQALRLDLTFVPPAAAVAAGQMAGTVPADFKGTVDVRYPILLWVGSLEYQAGDWLFAAEYSRWHPNVESSHPALVPTTNPVSERLYGMMSWHVAPWFTPGAYYSLHFPDMEKRSGRAASQHDVAATLRFDINPYWLLKVEGHFMHGTAVLSSSLNDNQPLDKLARDWGVLLLKTTAYF
ncbi:MAG TPA: hypothetical protein VJT73_19815 [Polyangiaceae bacterium]|nr:hypothetical protein [Polyangiaceae bacterium]